MYGTCSLPHVLSSTSLAVWQHDGSANVFKLFCRQVCHVVAVICRDSPEKPYLSEIYVISVPLRISLSSARFLHFKALARLECEPGECRFWRAGVMAGYDSWKK